MFGHTIHSRRLARKRKLGRARPGLLLALAVLLAGGLFTMHARLQPAESTWIQGEWLLHLGRIPRAEKMFQRYLDRDGNTAAGYARVGTAFLADERWGSAARYLERSLQRDPRRRVCLPLALAYDNLGRDSEAERLYQENVRRDPTDAVALNGLGYFYAQRATRLDEAVRLLHRALEFQPLNGGILDSLGWALYQQGDVAAAVPQLIAATESVPSSAEIRYHLGVVLARLGKRDRALVELGKAMILAPDLVGVREALALVRSGRRPPMPMAHIISTP